MAVDVIVPEVGEVGMDVTFVRWLKTPGEPVTSGEPLFEVDTEKSVMVVESWTDGVLSETGVSAGDSIHPQQVIGRITAPGEAAPTAREAAPIGSAAVATAGQAADAVPAPRLAATETPMPEQSSSAERFAPADSVATRTPGLPPGQARVAASPRARRLAADRGVDLNTVHGTGKDGLITEKDVEAAAQSGRVDRAERSRRAVAALTSSSWRTIPHFYLELEADVSQAFELGKPTPVLCAAVARALAAHPECNLEWQADVPVRRTSVDLGLLVDTRHGLLVTVIPNADRLELRAMAAAIEAAATRARAGSLATVDAGVRSLTVSNLGMYAVDRFAAVIPQPDVLALAVGRARTVARWAERWFRPTRVVDLTLSVDHRALDGAAAARFLSTLERILASPADLETGA